MSQPLFGVVVAGQPVTINPVQTPSDKTYVYAIPPPAGKTTTHLTVFLLPGATLPNLYAAAIYWVTQPAAGQSEPTYTFLGGLWANRGSVTFPVAIPQGQNQLGVGIEIQAMGVVQEAERKLTEEKRVAVEAQGSNGNTTMALAGNNAATTLQLAERIIKHAYNFMASFVETAPNGVDAVPLKAFENWWKKFEAKVRADPTFLERAQ